jgi:F-type H+-transporting ATPase subunit b
MNSLLYLAATEATHVSQNSDLFSALGIDGRLLLLQAAAFLVLVFILGKFVYPYLLKALDVRRAQAEETALNAKKAEEALAQVEQKVADILRSARAEAGDMIDRSQKEATSIVEEAEDKATKRAEHIVTEAKAQLDNDIRTARETLKQETTALVAYATEKVVKQKVDAKKDASLIESALKEAS